MKPNRFKPLALALFCTTVIAIALALDADPRGHSTHTQLGLSECGFKAYFNIPCPACGMTTSVTHWFHGEPLLALATQPFGAAFALLVSIGFLWAWKETIWPGANGWDGAFHWVHTQWWWIVGIGLAALGASWGYTLWRHMGS